MATLVLSEIKKKACSNHCTVTFSILPSLVSFTCGNGDEVRHIKKAVIKNAFGLVNIHFFFLGSCSKRVWTWIFTDEAKLARLYPPSRTETTFPWQHS